MGFKANQLYGSVWGIFPPDHTARFAAIDNLADGDRAPIITKHGLSVDEFARMAEAPFSSGEAHLLNDTAPQILHRWEEVERLVHMEDVDPAARRWAFQTSLWKLNDGTTAQEVYEHTKSMDPSQGRSDLLRACLPWFIEQNVDYNPAVTAGTVGPVTGVQALAAASTSILTDDQAWDLLTNPPQRWVDAAAEDKEWHERPSVREAIKMVFTHRPGLVARASSAPDEIRSSLAVAALKTAHWDDAYADLLPGFDWENEKVDADETSDTGLVGLQLVWHPNTEADRRVKLQRIGADGQENSRFSDQWEIVESSATTAQRCQPNRIDIRYVAAADPAFERVTKRVDRAFRKKTIPGGIECGNHIGNVQPMVWPDKLPEALELAANTNIKPGRLPVKIMDHLEAFQYTVPKGSVYEHVFAYHNLSGSYEPGKLWTRHVMAVPSKFKEEVFRRADDVFSDLESAEQLEAWRTLLRLMVDSAEEDVDTDTPDTVLALV